MTSLTADQQCDDRVLCAEDYEHYWEMVAILESLAPHWEGTDAPIGERIRAVLGKVQGTEP